MPLTAGQQSDYTIGDSETLTFNWSISADPTAVTFYARKGTTEVTWTTGGSGVTDNADGTGTWTITAGDLAPGAWTWWALFDAVIKDKLFGTLTVEDR